MTSWLGPLGPGFIGRFDEKRPRYFRWISARCRRNSVDGLKTIAERINRPDVSTTMVYTHVLNRGGLGVKSPIDRW